MMTRSHRPTKECRFPFVIRALSLVLIGAFSLAVFTTDVDHCLDACDDCHSEEISGHDLHAPPVGIRGGVAELSLKATSSEELPHGSSVCLGASCLCHQHPIPHGLETYDAPASLALVYPRTPLFPELGVTDEILHVPKQSV